MRPIAGRPLIDHTIMAAMAAQRLTRLCVTSDDPAILEHAASADIETVTRPAAMSADDVHASIPILHALEALGGTDAFDYCVMLLPTFPLRTAETIDAVIGRAVEVRENVISVTQLNKTIHHLRTLDDDGRIRHVTGEKRVNFQSQDAPLLYAINGCCYCAPARPLLQERSFQYGDPIAYVTPGLDAFDIDTEDDLRTTEALLATRA
jgi:CMP-N-acetylneuraminic acid synthetase